MELLSQFREETKEPNRIDAPVLSSLVKNNLFTPTFSLEGEQYIEGYLVKGIETKRLIQLSSQHLRFFRIIFSTGKMNVKENREDK